MKWFICLEKLSTAIQRVKWFICVFIMILFFAESLTDSLGVPLIDKKACDQVWQKKKKHVKCILDPPDVELYTSTGMLKKGKITLTTYRCARGSSSLESFHLHLNRFVPG